MSALDKLTTQLIADGLEDGHDAEPLVPAPCCAFEGDYVAASLAEEFLGYEFSDPSTKHDSMI